MNSQTNSTNFQQFVKDNQGKKITFLHNDKQVSTFIVDVCADYFTCKNQESDAKIDGFYYFSDCRVVSRHPLIDILEKQHNVVTLHFTNGMSSIFDFGEYNRGMINGTCLTTSHPVGFNPDSIKEAWAIVDGKYSKVWEKQPSQAPVSSKPPMDKLASYFEAQNSVKNACEKVNNTLEKLNNSFDKVFPKEQTKKDKDILETLKHNKYVTVKTKSKVWKNFTFNSIEGRFVLGDCEGTPTVIPLNNIITVEPSQEPVLSNDEQQYNLIKENFEKISELGVLLRNYVSTPGVVGQFIYTLSDIKDKEYSLLKLNAFKASWEETKENFMPNMKGIRADPKFQALVRRFVEVCILITVCPTQKKESEKLLEKVNNVMNDAGREEYNKHFNTQQKNIKYRGKPKTVEIVNEYTHINGKEYVLVKDNTDNGKTKTLFKEYIEWM